jgi:hypothetical protein
VILEPMGEMNILLGFFLGWAPQERQNIETASNPRPSITLRGHGSLN